MIDRKVYLFDPSLEMRDVELKVEFSVVCEDFKFPIVYPLFDGVDPELVNEEDLLELEILFLLHLRRSS